MKLVTCGINEEMNTIVQFPFIIQPCIQKQLILYHIKTMSVPIVDLNEKSNLYTKLQLAKTYITLNEETHTSSRHLELRNCKNIWYEFYCQELFVVKHNCGKKLF